MRRGRVILWAAGVAATVLVGGLLLAVRPASGPRGPAPGVERVRLPPGQGAEEYALLADLDGGGWKVYADYADAKRHLVIAIDPGSVTVVRVRGGRKEEIAGLNAPATGPRRLLVLRRAGTGRVAVDGQALCRAASDGPGRCGWSSVADRAPRRFQVRRLAPVLFTDDFMRAKNERGPWDMRSGQWVVEDTPHPEFDVNPFRCRQDLAGPALTLTGEWSWTDLSASAAVRLPESKGRAGIVAAAVDDRNFHLLRWDATEQRIDLVRRRDGRDTVLATRPLGLGAGQWHELRLDAAPGRLMGYVNGTLAVEAEDPALLCGRVGLYTDGYEGVLFDDFAAVDEARRDELPGPGKRPRLARAYESGRGPGSWTALAAYQCGKRPDGETWWRHHSTFFGDVSVEVPFTGWAEDGVAAATLASVVNGAAATLRLARRSEGRLTAVLLDGTRPLGPPVTLAPDAVMRARLELRSGRLAAWVGGQAAGSSDAPDLTSGVEASVSATGVSFDPQAVAAESPNALDYTFTRAPVHWRTDLGEWAVAPRWFCSPLYTWFQGRSDGLAIAWHRLPFDGDAALEMYAAFPMVRDTADGYRAARDLNATICADGRSPATGYTFFFGGWGNTASRLFRGPVPVAEAKGALLPTRRDLIHGALWCVKLERAGRRVRACVNGETVASFDDPDPLPGRYAALWTWDNDVIYPRVRVTYRDAGPAPLPPPVPRASDAGPQDDSCSCDFETGAGPWRGVWGSSEIRRIPRDSGGHCLEVTNPRPGGSFRVIANDSHFLVSSRPVLSFDFQAGPDVKTDLFLRAAGGSWRVALTGKPCPERDFITLGAARTTGAGDGWRHVAVYLPDAFRGFIDDISLLHVEQITLENRDFSDYLGAGFGANGPGAAYRVDNFYLGPASASASPHRRPPQVHDVSPSEGAETGDGVLQFRIDSCDAGVDPDSLRIEVNGRRYVIGQPGFDFRPLEQTVTLDLGRAGQVFEDGEEVRAAIAPLTDRLGDTGPGLTRAWRHVFRSDHRPPAELSVALPSAPRFVHGFETSLEGWARDGVSLPAALARDPRDAAAGCASLALTLDRLGGSWSAVMFSGPVDLRRHGVLTFAMKRESDGPDEIRALQNEAWTPVGRFAAPPDGRWHRIVCPLRSPDPLVHGLLFGPGRGDETHALGRQGQVLHIDDVQLLAAQGGDGTLRISWRATDASGIDGHQFVLDREPDTAPSGPFLPRTSYGQPTPPPGLYYAHVRCRDRAGNVTDTIHQPIPVGPWTDPTPPLAKVLAPLPETDAGGGEIRLNLSDPESDIDLGSVVLRVAGRAYDLSDPRLAYDPATAVLSWSPARAPDDAVEFADNEWVPCRLDAANLAGVAMAPLEWGWRFRTQLDAQPPEAPYVSWRPADRLIYEDYECDCGQARPRRMGAVFRQQSGSPTGKGHLGLTGWTNELWSGRAQADRWPVLTLDYRLPPGAAPALNFEVDGKMVRASLCNRTSDDPIRLAEFARWVADGHWRHSAIPLARMIKEAGGTETTVLFLSDDEKTNTRRIGIDNLSLGSMTEGVEFFWQPPADVSGIRGYSVVLDSSPGAVPPPRVNCAATTYIARDLMRPNTFLHVRACDRAGNWGPAGTVRAPVEELASGWGGLLDGAGL